jgi:glycosyltransferase involved in cell wall biosynthesis
MRADVTLVLSPADGSMERLAAELARHLAARTLITDIYDRSAEQFNLGWRRAPRLAGRDVAFIRRLRRLRGIVHFPNHHLARYGTFLREPFIVTVHDLIRHFDCRGGPPLIHRPNSRDRMVLGLDRAGICRATKVIAVSHTTKRDLIDYLRVAEERIAVIPPGIDTRRFRPVAAALLPYPYVLFVGSEHPRKNFSALLDALLELRRERDFKRLKLVKVGAAGGAEAPFRRDTERAISARGLGHEVVLRGHVSDDELVALYSGARCLVLPSLYEGFGLPPLEAMACGCPVVVSDRGALPETAGPAAIVTATSPRALAASLARVLSNRDLRERLVKNGFRHVRRFTWEDTARQTAQLYEELRR